MKITAEVAWWRRDYTDEQADALGSGLPGFTSFVDNGLLVYLRFEVETDHLTDGVDVAMSLATKAYRRAFGEHVDPVQVLVGAAEFGLMPSQLDLVGITEVGALTSRTRQAVHQRVDELPTPIGRPGGAPAWIRRAAELGTASWGPPRPARG